MSKRTGQNMASSARAEAAAKPRSAGEAERGGWSANWRQELYTGRWNIGFQFRDLHRMFRGLVQDTLRRHGSSVSHWGYLWALYEEDGLIQSELARRVRLMGPSVVAALNQMERLGLVRRQRSETDRRVMHVFLTERGRGLRREMTEAAVAGNEAALHHLTAEEVEQLLGLLAKVRIGLVEAEGRPADG